MAVSFVIFLYKSTFNYNYLLIFMFWKLSWILCSSSWTMKDATIIESHSRKVGRGLNYTASNTNVLIMFTAFSLNRLGVLVPPPPLLSPMKEPPSAFFFVSMKFVLVQQGAAYWYILDQCTCQPKVCKFQLLGKKRKEPTIWVMYFFGFQGSISWNKLPNDLHNIIATS